MRKLILSVIILSGFCALFSACAKKDTTAPLLPMTASFKVPGKDPAFFSASGDTAIVAANAFTSARPHDSAVKILGYIYKPNTVNADSVLKIYISLARYRAGMGAVGINPVQLPPSFDSTCTATIVDPSGTPHFASSGSVFFSAATSYGASGTFSFACDDGTKVDDGKFVVSWRGQH